MLRSTAGLRFYVSRSLFAIAPEKDCMMDYALQEFSIGSYKMGRMEKMGRSRESDESGDA